VSRTRAAADTDADLVQGCLDGDERAWNALLERHGSLVWAAARRAGLADADAADAFQNAWTIALEDLGRLRDADRFAPWIARIARHQAMRIRRGYGIARRAHEKVARDEMDHRRPEEEVVETEQRHGIQLALGQIGERCRKLLELLYFAAPQPAYADIAASTGMRIGSIGPTRARCLEKLKQELGGMGHA